MHDPFNIKIKCLIVDDEPPAREVIKQYIDQIPTLELIAECGNAIQAITILQRQEVDIVFLDIRMPQLNGIDFIKTLKKLPRIIFTTAYAEYALDGYELDVVDYLMKPVRFDRFLKAVNKAFPAQPERKINEPTVVAEQKGEPFVYFRADRKMVKIMLRDINYIESMKDYIKIVTSNATVITRQSISSVETMLPETDFLRVHRSFIVSVNKIKTFTSEVIEIERTEIPIGKLYRNEVMKVIS